MADNSKIEWTDATWNPVTGCSVTSPGCTHCYAMRLAGTRMKHHPSRAGLTRETKAGPVWTGEVRFNENWLDQPLRWARPRDIFVCAHGDLFHESVPDDWIDKVFAVMALAPRHRFQVLTKRAARMRAYVSEMSTARSTGRGEALVDLARKHHPDPDALCLEGYRWPLPNVWLGVSVEDQARADERIPELLQTPAAVRWISAEPLLGPVDLTKLGDTTMSLDAFTGKARHLLGFRDQTLGGLDWVVAGGESGPGARPVHPDWIRSLRDQCQAAGVPFHFKQWGDWNPSVDHDPERNGCFSTPLALHRDGRAEYRPAEAFKLIGNAKGDDGWVGMCRVGKKAAGALLDGREWREMPELPQGFGDAGAA